MGRNLLEPIWENSSLSELEVAIKCAPTQRSHNRLLAMKFLYFGAPHELLRKTFSITSRTLFNWLKGLMKVA